MTVSPDWRPVFHPAHAYGAISNKGQYLRFDNVADVAIVMNSRRSAISRNFIANAISAAVVML